MQSETAGWARHVPGRMKELCTGPQSVEKARSRYPAVFHRVSDMTEAPFLPCPLAVEARNTTTTFDWY